MGSSDSSSSFRPGEESGRGLGRGEGGIEEKREARNRVSAIWERNGTTRCAHSECVRSGQPKSKQTPRPARKGIDEGGRGKQAAQDASREKVAMRKPALEDCGK